MSDIVIDAAKWTWKQFLRKAVLDPTVYSASLFAAVLCVGGGIAIWWLCDGPAAHAGGVMALRQIPDLERRIERSEEETGKRIGNIEVTNSRIDATLQRLAQTQDKMLDIMLANGARRNTVATNSTN